MKLFAVPMSLREANDFVSAYHRHSRRTVRDGGKFAIGCSNGDGLVGVAIVGNPTSATYMDGFTAEVTRLCARDDDHQKNTESFLYAACWRASRAMGYLRLITYTLKSESGTSLVAAGWRILHETKAHNDWAAKARMTGRARQWQPIYGQQKLCWIVD